MEGNNKIIGKCAKHSCQIPFNFRLPVDAGELDPVDCARKCLAKGFNGVCNGSNGNNGNNGIDGIDGNGNDNIKSSCNAFTFLDGVCTLGCIENTTGGRSND